MPHCKFIFALFFNYFLTTIRHHNLGGTGGLINLVTGYLLPVHTFTMSKFVLSCSHTTPCQVSDSLIVAVNYQWLMFQSMVETLTHQNRPFLQTCRLIRNCFSCPIILSFIVLPPFPCLPFPWHDIKETYPVGLSVHSSYPHSFNISQNIISTKNLFLIFSLVSKIEWCQQKLLLIPVVMNSFY